MLGASRTENRDAPVVCWLSFGQFAGTGVAIRRLPSVWADGHQSVSQR